MQSRTGNEIRELFLHFFETKGHRRVHSSSLVPHNDPTLLFTNAGMNQFKDVFLGADKRDYNRATTSQKCVRAGGKHNDLENVGFTRRHHTFFEMLGNFSFGDYFKRDAVAYAWELVTSEEWMGIAKDRLYVTIFEGDPANGVPRDDEAEQYWMEVGVPKERIFQYGLKDNFWQMGETGPCGPCSEIFYDMGLEASEHGKDLPFGQDDARYVEIWNLVFMQFDRSAIADPLGKTTGYKLTPLPKPSIDTGMGLERVAAVLQNKISNFETDLFTPLIVRAAELTGLRTAQVAPVSRPAVARVSAPAHPGSTPPAFNDDDAAGLVTGQPTTNLTTGQGTEGFVTGHDFSRADAAQQETGASAPVAEGDASQHDTSEHDALKGHDFSRADEAQRETRALAPAVERDASQHDISEHDALKGHDFSRADEPQKETRALAPAAEGDASQHDISEHDALKGHDFSRAEEPQKETWALAPEGSPSAIESLTSNASLRIIADHARAATFLINDGVLPSNEGRGYVLRKIMRRAIRHGRLLGQEKPFLYQMVYAVRDLMSGAYPELVDSADRVAKVVQAEEKQFDRVLKQGSEQLDREISDDILKALNPVFESFIDMWSKRPGFEDLRAIWQSGPQNYLLDFYKRRDEPSLGVMADIPLKSLEHALGIVGPSRRIDLSEALKAAFQGLEVRLEGSAAFHLYETFGLPKDFMVDAARDAGVQFDDEGFERARAEEQARARASWKGGAQKTASPAFRDLPKTDFEGYRSLNSTDCEVLAIVKDGAGVPAANVGDQVEVVLDHTSFYGDSGGQIGDTGWFTSVDGNTTIAEITGCVLPVQGVRAHKAILKQPLAVGDHLNTVVNGERRDAIRRNHTGTHLIHAALRQVLGTHVKQAGSAVQPDRLRFDFSHFAQVADEELAEIENIVNREVLSNAKVETLVDVPIDVAVNEYHAMALFGEKYGDKVRVVKLSDGFSTELCGGTHTSATGEIGLLKLTGETSVSSGVRRVEAISGFGSLDSFRRDAEVAHVAAQVAGAPGDASLADSLRARLTAHEEELKRLRRELDEMRMKSAAGGLDSVVSQAVEVKGVKLLRHRADNLDRGQLRTLVDNLKQKAGEAVIVIASAQPEGKVAIIAGVTPGLVKRIQAGKLVGAVAKLVGGSGGGKPDIAEAGGKDQGQIAAALEATPQLLSDLLG